VLEQAKVKLQQLENNAYLDQQKQSGINQLDLFSSPECHPVVNVLENTNPDELNPKQALDLLYRLKKML